MIEVWIFLIIFLGPAIGYRFMLAWVTTGLHARRPDSRGGRSWTCRVLCAVACLWLFLAQTRGWVVRFDGSTASGRPTGARGHHK